MKCRGGQATTDVTDWIQFKSLFLIMKKKKTKLALKEALPRWNFGDLSIHLKSTLWNSDF